MDHQRNFGGSQKSTCGKGGQTADYGQAQIGRSHLFDYFSFLVARFVDDRWTTLLERE